MGDYVHVAVGVIRDAGGRVLLAKRRADVHQGGLWEFPGGKMEAGESVDMALRRELREELDIEVRQTVPLIQIRHHYSDKSVLLDVREVTACDGIPKGNEGQPLAWVGSGDLEPGDDRPYRLPAANASIIRALQLPHMLMITGEARSRGDFLERLKRALDGGVRLVQFRPSRWMERLPMAERQSLADEALSLCAERGARLVFNAGAQVFAKGGHGLHLPAAQLMAARTRPVPAGQLLGASCHNRAELLKAAELEADYVLLSPVQATGSHTDAVPMGWETFQSLVEAVNVPVYALGGMAPEDVLQARTMGAQGIAAIGALWDALPAVNRRSD